MATFKSTNAVSHEDLGDTISRISPEKTPFRTEIGKSKATNTYHETVQDTLAAANKDNAALEGADAVGSTLTPPTRVGNYTQTFRKEVKVSGTVRAINTVGSKDEYARQIAKAGAEINRDIEAALVSQNASRAESGSNARKLGGASAWIATNADHGAGGSTAGFSGSTVGAVVDGTARPLTKEMFDEMAQSVWAAGGDPTMVIAPGSLKQRIAGFATGNGAWNQDASKSTIYAGVDYYVSDFGRHQIVPHHFMTSTDVIMFDPSLWNTATLRAMAKVDLAKTGDSDNKLLVTELTLESLNEAGNGKIADVE